MAIKGTMEVIQRLTFESNNTSNIEFTNISQTYDDLVIKISTRNTGNNAGMSVRFNGDAGGNYLFRILYGTGVSAASFNQGSFAGYNTSIFAYIVPSTANASIFSNTDIYIPNYRGSNSKLISIDSVSEDNATGSYQSTTAGLWSNTAAITSIRLISDPGGNASDLARYSTATLYGVTRIPALAKATGGVITEDSTHWYHTFTSSGVFTPNQSFSADVLVIAGGGGGGSGNNSGGGGAGGLLAFTSQSLSAQNYTVTVGAGGATGNPNGVVGSDSQFGSLTLVKGGGLGAGDPNTGGNGGSGGGNGWSNSGTAGQPTSGQGFAGGPGENIPAGPNYFGGGGGGAGEAGNTDAIGQGGDGVSTYSSWGVATSTGQDISGTRWFAGGGGGSGQSNSVNRVGGDGGGGRGAGVSGAAQAGTANTGGGGGGSGNSAGNTGAAGGSGIVIVRYAK